LAIFKNAVDIKEDTKEYICA